jgi:hypothetical protein
MRCRDLDGLLALADAAAAFEGAPAAAHLGRCRRCRDRHREVAWLLGVPRPGTTARGRRVALRVAAAVLLALAATFLTARRGRDAGTRWSAPPPASLAKDHRP